MKRMLIALFALSLLLPGKSALSQGFQYRLGHIANGTFQQGSFRTVFIFLNNTDMATSVVLRLTGDTGSPMPVTIPELGTKSVFEFTLDAGATRFLQTDGSGPLVGGSAEVTAANVNICVSAIFTVYETNANFATEAGVGATQPMTESILPVDVTGAFDTGVALFNQGTSPAEVTLILFDLTGKEYIRANLTPVLVGGAHVARFVDQFFPNVHNFRGTLVVRSSAPILAVTLRQNLSKGLATYTSLPVVPRSSTATSMNFPQVANGRYGSFTFQTSFLVFNISSYMLTFTPSVPMP